jgi:hypothetical protein
MGNAIAATISRVSPLTMIDHKGELAHAGHNLVDLLVRVRARVASSRSAARSSTTGVGEDRRHGRERGLDGLGRRGAARGRVRRADGGRGNRRGGSFTLILIRHTVTGRDWCGCRDVLNRHSIRSSDGSRTGFRPRGSRRVTV